MGTFQQDGLSQAFWALDKETIPCLFLKERYFRIPGSVRRSAQPESKADRIQNKTTFSSVRIGYAAVWLKPVADVYAPVESHRLSGCVKRMFGHLSLFSAQLTLPL